MCLFLSATCARARRINSHYDSTEAVNSRTRATGDEATAPDTPTPEEDSVAQRVRRRRVGRGGRERRPRDEDAGAAADGDAGGEAWRGRRGRGGGRHNMYLLNSFLDINSSNSDSDDSDEDSDEDDEEEIPFNRRRRARPEVVDAEIIAEVKTVMEKKQPKHDFHITKEIINRSVKFASLLMSTVWRKGMKSSKI